METGSIYFLFVCLFLKFYIYFMLYGLFFLHVCVPPACSIYQGQERAEDPLKLEHLQVVLHHVGPGNST